MIDIKKELDSIQDDFNSKYVTLYDIIEFLKNESGASYSEVAQYLLFKMLPYEPIPDRDFEENTGIDSYRCCRFLNQDYLMPYSTPSKPYQTIEYIYFEEIKDMLKLLEAFDDYSEIPF